MAQIAKAYSDRLPELKKCVENYTKYFQRNIDRYNNFMRFVFDTSLTEQQKAGLQSIGMPTIEFNILEAYVSRLRGEFAKQQPDLVVRAEDGVLLSQLTPRFNETLKVVEGYLRAIFFDGTNDMLEYNIYSDLLAGGFSAAKVYTTYTNELSFEQKICVDRVYNPTLCGFDPLAVTSHKGDGRYCYELFPMTKDKFEQDYGKEATKNMKFTKNVSDVDWSYLNEGEEIVLLCDFYEKKVKRVKIVKLSNGHVVTEKEYKEFLKEWEEAGFIEQPPIPVGEPRWTQLETIDRYRFCETKLIDHVETNYKQLPIVFIDGNSVTLNDTNGCSQQMTRPYVYHAAGIQRLKNLAGESLGNELENTLQSKFIAARESLDKDYLRAYTHPQKADVLLYNHFLDKNNPEITLPPPREVQRTQIPPEISNTFQLSDQMTMAILGSFDGSNGLDRAPMSGIAFARSSITSNNAAMPYIVGYIKGLNRVAQLIIDLIPKYYRTPRSLPVLKASGAREYVEINKPGSLYMDYSPNDLQVKVDVGVNFAMQKEISMQSMTAIAQSMPIFAEFMGQYGLQPILENLDIRGIDELKEKAVKFEQQKEEMAKMAQQQQQAQAQQMQQETQMQMMQAQKELASPTQGQVAMIAIQQQGARDEEKAKMDAANVAIKQQEAEVKFLELLAKIRNEQVNAELKKAEVQAENQRSAVDMAISLASHQNDKRNLEMDD